MAFIPFSKVVELKPHVFPHDETRPDAGHHPDVPILGDDEADASRNRCAIPHHRPVPGAVMVVLHRFELEASGIACSTDLGREVIGSDHDTKAVDLEMHIHENETIHSAQ